MELNQRVKSLCQIGLLFTLSTTALQAGIMGEPAPLGSIYLGVFGGGGGVRVDNLNQYGTAFYTEAQGGPLAVNAFGSSVSDSTWLVGGHIGFQWPGQLFTHLIPSWGLVPAFELEGYYLGGVSFVGDDLNNGTTRLTEHDFRVTYPMKTGVFLINAVLNSNNNAFGNFHPYIGLGVGPAVVSISNADALQTAPLEAGVNHYNSDPNDTTVALAAQPKIGINFSLNPDVTVFAEYRFLYLSNTDFMFGSTVYPTHPATSNWEVKLGPQYYNMGTIGIQCNI